MELYAVFRKSSLMVQGIEINHGRLFYKHWKETCLCLYKTRKDAEEAIKNRYGSGYEIKKVFLSCEEL